MAKPSIKQTVDIFYKMLRNDIGYESSPYALNDKEKHYYNLKYRDRLVEQLSNSGVLDAYQDKELRSYGENRIKMCSIASSSRLCYLYFRDEIGKGFEVEKKFPFVGDNGKINNSNLDGYMGNTVYECKCQEILGTHNTYLASHFYKNLIKDSFNIEGDIRDEKDYLFPTLKQFDLKLENCEKRTIYSMHLDIKQLITHLLGLAAREDKDEVIRLQYVVFRPSDDNDGVLKSFYSVIDSEFRAIKESKVFSRFMDKHKIELPDIQYVQVKDATKSVLR